jgi:hypothetical protein
MTAASGDTVLTALSGAVIFFSIFFGFFLFAFRIGYVKFDPGPLPLRFRRKCALFFTRPGVILYILLCLALTFAMALGMQ